MTELFRLGIKLLAADSSPVRLKEFVPVFHSWIQKQSIEGHLLIDVHDYSHIHRGPGILLVGDEGNFSTDMADGKFGLVYFRKRPAGNTLEEQLRVSLNSVLHAASLLEADPGLQGQLRFRRDEFLVIANDRLLAPNDDETFEAVEPALSTTFGPKATFARTSNDPKERLTIRVTVAS